jgi:hypothetical protein
MGTVTAIRVREHRVRQKLGRACLEIECDEIGLIAALRNTPFWQSANFCFLSGHHHGPTLFIEWARHTVERDARDSRICRSAVRQNTPP